MAAGNGSHGSDFDLDIQQIFLETQHRWLRPAEICEILRNHRKFHIAPEPSHMPPSGSIFLFDRKVLRYFRKDGHSWRKKKDGKTVKEAHEKLKVGSVDMLHCYYAHGEENEYFQRRSYWMLEPDLTHIVFVHYLDVKGNKTNISRVIDTDKAVSTFQNGSPLPVTSPVKHKMASSAYTDSTSPTSTLTSACEDVDSEENHQASSRFRSFLGAGLMEDSCMMEKTDADQSSSYLLPCSDAILEQGDEVLGQLSEGEISKLEAWNSQSVQGSFQFPFEDHALHLDRLPGDQSLSLNSAYDLRSGSFGTKFDDANLQPGLFYRCHDDQGVSPGQHNLQKHHSNAEPGYMMKSSLDTNRTIKDGNYSFIVEQPLFDGFQLEEGLKKVDSFSRWMSKELGEVEELPMQSTDGIPWSVIESGDAVADSALPTQLQVDPSLLNPSISQDQIFSIINFSPNWAYSNLSTKVLITGKFLKCEQDIANCKLACMFGEVEVPAEVLADGVLRCYAPPHFPGRVPFYVTCSNRLACSEVREFEYQIGTIEAAFISESSTTEMLLYMRLERLLSVGFSDCLSEYVEQKQNVVCQIVSVMEEKENNQIMKTMPENDLSQLNLMEKLNEKQLKEKLYSWLLFKATEDGKGPSVLDEEGQGVLHLAAALGYNWALRPTTVSGVSIDFRDANGWTALHWAAYCGREDTVAVLVSLGAAPGALADPSPQFPLGRTPADLASGNGHKGISGFLAESSLTTYLSALTVSDQKEDSTSELSGVNAVQTVAERMATPTTAGDGVDVLSLKDSLDAVRNATQAASRIHQIFRMRSFDRKQFIDHNIEESGSSDERALSLVAARTSRLSKTDGTAHSSAICIQKKFRGWKKRQEFLIMRQRIVKIQAHVRGHQVRKKYKGITWSVGILEKVILRWRRKGSGLRGFHPDTVVKGPDSEEMPSEEDDYDFLKEGRKQNEVRLQKALARVKSMVHYPEARAQYRRLLTVAEGIREPKQEDCDMILNSSDDTVYDEEDLIDVGALFDDDTFMSIAFD